MTATVSTELRQDPSTKIKAVAYEVRTPLQSLQRFLEYIISITEDIIYWCCHAQGTQKISTILVPKPLITDPVRPVVINAVLQQQYFLYELVLSLYYSYLPATCLAWHAPLKVVCKMPSCAAG